MQPTLGVLFDSYIVLTFTNMLSFVPIFLAERAAFARERAHGLCGALPWALALLDVESCFTAIQARRSSVCSVRAAFTRTPSLL
jgi:hypothetical protein